jgi:hypothetical protein
LKIKGERQRKGQILLLAVLLISLLMISTQLCIYEVGRSTVVFSSPNINSYILSIKLGSEHVVTGTLANISNGGEKSILSTNLEDWTSFIENLYQFGKPILDSSFPDNPLYTGGTRLSWGTDGFGASSTVSDFNLSILDNPVNAQLSFRVNITTSLLQEAEGRIVQNDVKQINVSSSLFNEGVPALGTSITVFFLDMGTWKLAQNQSSYFSIDYGNGTYLTSFEVDTPQVSMGISVCTLDLRGIYVQANSTLTL